MTAAGSTGYRGAVEVRPAETNDWPGVAAMLAELGRPAVIGSDEEDDHRAAFAAYLARPDTAALVAEDEGRVVGFLDVEYRQRLNFLRPQAWIPDLIVAEDTRSRGIGTALLTRAEELARERDCWGMTLESATWREDAHRFYLRAGWQQAGYSFTRSHTGQPWPPPPPG